MSCLPFPCFLIKPESLGHWHVEGLRRDFVSPRGRDAARRKALCAGRRWQHAVPMASPCAMRGRAHKCLPSSPSLLLLRAKYAFIYLFLIASFLPRQAGPCPGGAEPCCCVGDAAGAGWHAGPRPCRDTGRYRGKSVGQMFGYLGV